MATGRRDLVSRDARLERDHGERQARRIREHARRIGRGQAVKNLRLWLALRDDEKQPAKVRLEAAREIEDRYGQPRQTGIGVGPLLDLEPKLISIRSFAPPAGWLEAGGLEPEISTGGAGNGSEPARPAALPEAPESHPAPNPAPVATVSAPEPSRPEAAARPRMWRLPPPRFGHEDDDD